MNRTHAIIALIIVAGLTGIGLSWWALTPPIAPTGPFEPLSIAWSPYESTALVWIAADRGFFDRQALCVTMRRYDSGAASLAGVEKGEADLAVGVTEYPLVRAALANASVGALAVIDRGEFNYLVARTDRGIGTVQDLRGKRVGTALGTIAEFHLARSLALQGITPAEIILVDLPTPAEWVNAAAEGTVDAVATSQPYANAARDRLGANAVMLPLQSDRPLYALAVASDGWIGGHPDEARRFLRSLADAEAYADAHPDESKAIVQQRLGLDPGYMATVWRQNRYALSLDQSLVAAMEDEARWMIRSNMTNATTVPDFMQYIDTTALEAVDPSAVRILGGAGGGRAP
jgi:NitT/TauT family transport system substrate-binding protein